MTISFVGAGPGAADLITLRGAQRLAAADIVIWAASLVPEALLDHCRADVELHDSKTMTHDEVCAVYAANPGPPSCACTRGTPPSTAPSPSRSTGAGATTGTSRSSLASPRWPPPPPRRGAR
ncbi:MAG: hypothetical protein GEV08_24400 [Acidimicrobiia bacterium]|nr:hypothetical protein [Acidimicrobiia bacterium]